MQIKQRHDWNLTTSEAKVIHEELQKEVITEDKFKQPVKYVAGVDMGFEDNGKTSRAAV
ncbi:MAG: endonuclease V, partial [Rivularia sp. (in: cyanobacteria)]